MVADARSLSRLSRDRALMPVPELSLDHEPVGVRQREHRIRASARGQEVETLHEYLRAVERGVVWQRKSARGAEQQQYVVVADRAVAERNRERREAVADETEA